MKRDLKFKTTGPYPYKIHGINPRFPYHADTSSRCLCGRFSEGLAVALIQANITCKPCLDVLEFLRAYELRDLTGQLRADEAPKGEGDPTCT